ncbi:hypothetical protein AB5I41_04515 [Sphingomonas sp. MMS24-JH45]
MLGPVPAAYRDRASSIRRHVGGLDRGDRRPRHRGADRGRCARPARGGGGDRGPARAGGGRSGTAGPAPRRATDGGRGGRPRLGGRCAGGGSARLAPCRQHVDRRAGGGGDGDRGRRCRAARGDRDLGALAMLAGRTERELLALDDEHAGEDDGAPLLGVGFALRLARHLAGELRRPADLRVGSLDTCVAGGFHRRHGAGPHHATAP